MHDLGKGATPADMLPRHIGHEARSTQLLKGVCERLRVPVDCRELAEVVARAMTTGITGAKVGEMIHAARIAAVASWEELASGGQVG